MTMMSTLRNAFSGTRIIAGGRAAGLKIVAKSADPNFARGTYELPMQEAIAANLQPGDVFYDVGANIGFFTMIAARCVGQRGCVYAYEPVPGNVATIARNLSINGIASVELFAEAVGARNGRADLLLAHHIGGAALATAGSPPDVSGKIQVDVVTLDGSIAARRLRPPSLVKIDVEGGEIDVLKGMTQTIKSHRPKIIYEIDDASREGLRRKADVIAAFLVDAGYAIAALPASYPNDGWYVEHMLATDSN